jgi:hypothetical protein
MIHNCEREGIVGTNLDRLERFRAAYKAGKGPLEELDSDRAGRLEIVASGAVLFLGSYWGFRLATLSWKPSLAINDHWLWWAIGAVYFFLALSFITALGFALARHYIGFAPTAATKLSCRVHNSLAATLMISAAVTQDDTARAALAMIGFEHLFWLLLGTAFLVFLHMGSVIVSQPE